MSTNSTFYQQIRRVECGGVRAKADGTGGDFDMEVTLSRPRDERLQFEVRIWNLAPDTWRSIQQGELVRILLGWGETRVETMCVGAAERKYTETDESDTVFILTGTDDARAALDRTRRSHTFFNRTAGTIARRIANFAGLAAGRIDDGPTLVGCWAMKARCAPLDFWLDELVEDTERVTGEQWEWYVSDAKLNFEKRSAKSGTAFVLDEDNSSVNPVHGETTKTSGGEELDFDAYLDPRVQKGAYVRVSATQDLGIYKVAEYEIDSSTLDGTHEMTGKLAPSDALYRLI